jgi:hypothetical protein
VTAEAETEKDDAEDRAAQARSGAVNEDPLAEIRRALVYQRGAGNLATLQKIQEIVWPADEQARS